MSVSLAPQDYPSFDPVIFGRRMKAARIMAGYEDAADLARELRRLGMMVTAERIKEVEAGAVPSYPLVALVAALTCPPGGRLFFEEAFSPAVREHMAMLHHMEPR